VRSREAGKLGLHLGVAGEVTAGQHYTASCHELFRVSAGIASRANSDGAPALHDDFIGQRLQLDFDAALPAKQPDISGNAREFGKTLCMRGRRWGGSGFGPTNTRPAFSSQAIVSVMLSTSKRLRSRLSRLAIEPAKVSKSSK
jgi:hypothetical protein